MPTHIWLHDPEEDTESELAPPVKNSGGVPDQQLPQQQPPQPMQPTGSSPFHQISARNHSNLAEYHEAAGKQQGLGPEELEAHQRAGHAHALAAQAHQREMPEALKFGEIAQKHSATAEDMTRDRQKMFLRR